MLTKNEIIQFTRENPLFFLATTDGKKPYVRGIMMFSIDDRGDIIFTTGKTKALYSQLIDNPNVELCFHTQDQQVRLTGTAVETDILTLKKAIVEARSFMKPWIEASGFEIMAVFKVINNIATHWHIDKPLSRKRFIKLYED